MTQQNTIKKEMEISNINNFLISEYVSIKIKEELKNKSSYADDLIKSINSHIIIK
jgi:hypothetical protein